MNLVGKIFVFLIFVMSLMFATFSVLVYATHKNWMDEVMRETAEAGKQVGWKKQLEDKQQMNHALQNQLRDLKDQLASEKAALRQQVAKLETEKERLGVAQQETLVQYTAKVEENKQLNINISNAQNRLSILRTETEAMRQEISQARGDIDKKYKDLLVLAEQNHQAAGEAKRLKIRQDQLVENLSKAERVLKDADLSIESKPGQAPPPVNGIVTKVQKHQDDIYVEVTVGSDDGLAQGHTMEVFRGGTYLGQIAIVRTTPDRSVGKVDRKRQRGQIQVRDRVETRRALKTAGV